MTQKLVSIMVPAYNSALTLPLALASIINQTYSNWEVLLVDDGSTDGTQDLASRYEDKRIHYIRLAQNRGRAYARQTALDAAQGEYLAMVDSDDWIMPKKVQYQVQILEQNPDLALVSTSMYLSKQNGNLHGVARLAPSSAEVHKSPPLRSPMPLPIFHAPTMARRNLLQGRSYDLRLKRSEDLDFFLPILMAHSFGMIAEPLYVYSYEENRSWKAISEQLRAHLQVFEKFRDRFPREVFQRRLLTYGKMLSYSALFKMGLQNLVIGRNMGQPTTGEAEAFTSAFEAVSALARTRT